MVLWSDSSVDSFQPADARGVLFDYVKHPDFKRLLNQLLLQQQEKGFRSVTILSKFQGEGKTFLTAVLALGYALYLGRKVIIIDTVSKSRFESFFLGRVLAEDRPERTSVGNRGSIDLMTMRALTRQIRLLQRPTQQESNLISPLEGADPYSTDFRIGTVLSLLRTKYDLVLIDTHAFQSSAKDNVDPLIIAKQADTSLVVTSHRSLERSALASLKNDLSTASVNVLATVHNPAEMLAKGK